MYLTPDPSEWGPTLAAADPGYTMSDAAQWIRDRWAEFVALEPAILDLQHRAAVTAGAARQNGDEDTYQKARRIILDLGELGQLHLKVVDRMRSLAPYIGLELAGAPELQLTGEYSRPAGLGAIPVPVALATVFASIALVMGWLISRVELQRDLVAGLEAGTLTQEDLDALASQPPATDVLGTGLGLAKLALWAFLGFMAWQIVRDVGAFRANPDLLIFEGNPRDGGAIIGEHVYTLAYRHAQDSSPYYHDFGEDVEVWGEPDGTVTLRHRDGRPLWRDFS